MHASDVKKARKKPLGRRCALKRTTFAESFTQSTLDILFSTDQWCATNIKYAIAAPASSRAKYRVLERGYIP